MGVSLHPMSSFSLESIIAKKKRALEVNSTPCKRQKKYKSRREIEEEKRAAEEAAIAQKKAEAGESTEEPAPQDAEETTTPEEEERKPQYERDEVIKRLRQVGLVVTYFGETDWEREQRWLQYDTSSKEDFSYNKGLKNDFDDLMRNLASKGEGDDSTTSAADEDFLRVPINQIFDGLELCDEDRVLVMFRVRTARFFMLLLGLTPVLEAIGRMEI